MIHDRFPAELPMRFTTTSDGVRIAYAVVGEGSTCLYAGPAGACHSALLWKLYPGMLAPLARHLRLVLYDWRNSGLSGATEEGFTTEAGMRDLEAVIEAVAPGERVSILARASASLAVLPYAATNPERLARLVLIFALIRGTSMPRSWFSYHELVDDEPELALKFSATAGLGPGAPPDPKWEHFLGECSPLHYQARLDRLVKTLDVSHYVPIIQSRW